MKVVIVDDEYYAMQGLKMELQEIDGIEIAGMYQDSLELLDEITRIQPDIVFLDIEMPQMNGFELLEKIVNTGCTPNIVFVTAFSHYAVQAFEINAIDYIMKPVTKNRLLKTFERFQSFSVPSAKINLQMNCFKHFSIMANGKDINSGWRTRKAEELIAFLISENGSYVSKEKIADALWSDQNRESALSNLYMAYYYIKKQENKTGVRIPIESTRGKMRLDMDTVDCDLMKFNKLIEESGKNTDVNDMSFVEKALELYQGLPFEDSYYSWTAPIQSYYEYKYMETLNRLLEFYQKEGNENKVQYYKERSICL